MLVFLRFPMFAGWNLGGFDISEIRISAVSYEVAATISLAHRYILEFSTYVYWTIAVSHKTQFNKYLRVNVFELLSEILQKSSTRTH